MGADIQIFRQLTVEQHSTTFDAFGPKVFGHFATRKQRIYLWPDVVRYPIQLLCFPVLCNFRPVNHLYEKLQLTCAMQGAQKDKQVSSQWCLQVDL